MEDHGKEPPRALQADLHELQMGKHIYTLSAEPDRHGGIKATLEPSRKRSGRPKGRVTGPDRQGRVPDKQRLKPNPQAIVKVGPMPGKVQKDSANDDHAPVCRDPTYRLAERHDGSLQP